jgi:hypothetical protein
MVGIGAAASSPTSLKITGPTINADADGTVAVTDSTWSLTKNDANTRTFYGWKLKPTINTGGSNANTTVNALFVDTTNTANTGVTTNLLNLNYGGAQKFNVDSSGHILAEGVTSTGATGTGKFVFDNAPTIAGHPTLKA